MNTATNPYQSPQGELLNENDQEYGEIRFFSPSCRIGRVRYLAHGILVMLVFGVLIGIIASVALTGISEGGSMGPLSMIAVGLIYVAYTVCLWILVIQRCHDLDKSGWFSLLLLVPLVNIVVGLYVLFAPGTRGTNHYGKRPPPNSTMHVLLVCILPAIFILGIVAAVSIPAYQDYVERANSTVLPQ